MSRKQKYDYHFKLDLVKMIIRGENSVNGLSDMHGFAKSQLQFWCKLYEYHGNQGLEDIITKSYTVDEKLEIIRYYQTSGLSLMDTCAILRFASFSTLHQWVLKFEETIEFLLFLQLYQRWDRYREVKKIQSPQDRRL